MKNLAADTIIFVLDHRSIKLPLNFDSVEWKGNSLRLRKSFQAFSVKWIEEIQGNFFTSADSQHSTISTCGKRTTRLFRLHTHDVCEQCRPITEKNIIG